MGIEGSCKLFVRFALRESNHTLCGGSGEGGGCGDVRGWEGQGLKQVLHCGSIRQVGAKLIQS